MICAGINISTTSCPRLTPLLAFYVVTSTSAIHRSKSTAIKPSYVQFFEYSQTVWDPYSTGAVQQVEAVQWRAARYTLSRYRHTSSVTAMLSELNWQSLAERRRHARLVMFYKIHFQLVHICMPLTPKHHLQPTHTENTFAYMIPSSACDYCLQSFYPSTVRDWNTLVGGNCSTGHCRGLQTCPRQLKTMSWRMSSLHTWVGTVGSYSFFNLHLVVCLHC